MTDVIGLKAKALLEIRTLHLSKSSLPGKFKVAFKYEINLKLYINDKNYKGKNRRITIITGDLIHCSYSLIE